jgi:O-antigen ligase
MLGSPMAALVVLIAVSFTRYAVQIPGLPAEPAVLAFCALIASVCIGAARQTLRFRFGLLEGAMLAYFAWNVLSAVMPHPYPAATAKSIEIVVYRFILSGTVVPFVAFIVGYALLRSLGRLKLFMSVVLAAAAYSAVVSILQFTGPAALVWPSYIVSSPNYPERAVGIFNQPVINGLVMVAGFVIGMLLLGERTISRFPRIMAALVAVLCLPGIYLTRTRAVWLALGISLVLCAVLARGRRAGFVATVLAVVLFVGVNWATFTSSDREAGGVASSSEVDDRLNAAATSVAAIGQEPVFGWGIARFAQVNTYQHKTWDETRDFQRGYGISSHENELGIATELGLVGLGLWLLVLVLIGYQLIRAARRLWPIDGLLGRALALLAVTVFGTFVVSGFTLDLRFFDFASLVVFLCVGAAIGCSGDLAGADGDDADDRLGQPS